MWVIIDGKQVHIDTNCSSSTRYKVPGSDLHLVVSKSNGTLTSLYLGRGVDSNKRLEPTDIITPSEVTGLIELLKIALQG